MKCNNCSYTNSAASKFCRECGQELKKEITSKIICSRCDFANKKTNKFCQECGGNLDKTESTVERLDKSFKNDIDDVIFHPKKNGIGKVIKGIALAGAVLLLGGILLLLLIDTTIPDDMDTTESQVSNVVIEVAELEWIGEELYFTGVLKNNNNDSIQNVQVRIDFFRDQAGEEVFDTRTVEVAGADSLGAFSFQVPVYTYPEGEYWWNHSIVSINN